jgi:metallophosphoesterase superfamily enzyme
LVPGNHDHRLPALLAEWDLAIRTVPVLDPGRFRLIHGHEPAPVGLLEPPDRLVLIGHENPSVELGEGVATRMKCPAFAWDERTRVIPAFSGWAAGCNLPRRDFLGPVARSARFHTVAACSGPRLLRIPCARLLQDAASAGAGSRA